MSWQKIMASLALAGVVAGCGNSASTTAATGSPAATREEIENGEGEDSIWTLFNRPDAEATVQVNRYLWFASLDILSFLPVETVDPFTGLIVTGYGTPPGGGTSYRATVHVTDPALDARALSVSLQTRSGPVNAATTRAVEDAILSRARQLRIEDDKF
ncbi:MAG: hypothetical protein CML68_14335 [Rhodobacteraceae bacterium]|nr:hypothetical protein [Paracoccaceae bacterium]